jgi:MFS family permease
MAEDIVIPAHRAQPRPWHRATAGLSALLLGIGFSRFGFAPLIPALIQAHWFGAADAAYLGAANLMGYLIGAAAAHRLAQLLPPVALIKISMLAAAACFFACAFPLGFAWYFPWRLLAGIVGGLLMVLAPSAILAETPEARRGRVAGVIFTGVGAGIALSGTLVPWLVQFGLPATWFALGFFGLALTALSWGGWPHQATMPAARKSLAPRPRFTLPLLLLIAAYTCCGLGFVPHTVFWVDYIARFLGWGLASGGFYWVLMGFGAAAGPLLCGLLAERLGFARSFALGLPGLAVCVGLPLLFSQPVFLAISSLGVGGIGLGMVVLGSGCAGELVPIEQQRQVWGWMTATYAVTYAGGGYALSFLFARTGSYELLFAIGSGAMLLGGLLALPGALRPRALRRGAAPPGIPPAR